jgi:hypothetical protein
MISIMLRLLAVLLALSFGSAHTAEQPSGAGSGALKFKQLEELLPTPNAYRTASGAPGHAYWQQRADYLIDVSLDDQNQRITGSELVTYHNHSPDRLEYLWMQLDANIYAPDADGKLAQSAPDMAKFPYDTLGRLLALETFPGGTEIQAVRDHEGRPLSFTVVKTMLRIDLPLPLEPGASMSFSVDWTHAINDQVTVGGRSGYEYFKDDGNYIYEIAQFYPRMVAYSDATGWQHKQFIGSGEFTLELGNFTVRITAPDDHVVAATGVLVNADDVLSARQRERLEQARNADKPVFVVTPREAKKAEQGKPSGTKTWVFEAENVRDFAFASSRKFIWDAWGYHQNAGGQNAGGQNSDVVMAMSFYPNEAEPLWSQYSTHAIVHTMEVYSRYTFDYPYPVSQSINGPVGGMEYPMITFNRPRPYEDGTYWDKTSNDPDDDSIEWKYTKYGLISVIIHEVGHNYFPMIVNTDERQWTWMDEGINTFLQYLAEQEWEDEYPSRRGKPKDIVAYMSSAEQVPIMTNSESLLQFGNNAYGKPATALSILRESILGPELFDFAFREYARRWKFKRPMPADFFRTMEDASGIDLDWFWRGWFYTTDNVDIGIRNVHLYSLDTGDASLDKPARKAEQDAEPQTAHERRFQEARKRVDLYPELNDFYNTFDPFTVLPSDRESFAKLIEKLEEEEAALLNTSKHFYVVELENVGGLVMPVYLQIEYADGGTEEMRIPAEIWRKNALRVNKLLLTDQPIEQLTVDAKLETADVDLANNHWPRKPVKSRFQLFKQELRDKNPMQELEAEGN